MMQDQPPTKVSQERWAVLNDLRHYYVLSFQLLKLLRTDTSEDALRVLLGRMEESRWIVRTRLENEEACYALGPRGQNLFGVKTQPEFPFQSAGLLRHLGIATVCVLSRFRRLLPSEFHEQFPGIHRRGLPAHNYILDTQSATPVLMWAIVDEAHSATRFPAKIARFMRNRNVFPAFAELVRSDRFSIMVITATPEKKIAIEKALRARSAPWTKVHVLTVPSLIQFLL